MKILVTGASGFLGRNLVVKLAGKYDVCAPGRAQLDLLNEDSVRRYLKQQQFDVIVHSATVRANRRIGAPAGLMQQNCRMYFNLVRNADDFGRLLFFSSGAVYDRRHPVVRVAETDFDRSVPTDPYGFSKYICAQHIAQTPNVFDLRLFGIFGPYEDWEIRFLSNACCHAVRDLPVVIKQNVRFDYLDVADLARILPFFIQGQPRHRAYNVCTGRAVDLTAFARKVVCAAGKNLPVIVREPGLGNEYSGDNRRLLDELPEFQFTPIDASVAALYRWYLARKDEIDPARLHFDAPAMAATVGSLQETHRI